MGTTVSQVPGLPSLASLYCTTVLLKTTCSWPESLYYKKTLYGGLAAIGLGAVEIFLVIVFFLAFFKMPHDFTKQFLFSVYFPVVISSVFKFLGGVIGYFLGGPYGFYFETCLMMFMYFYEMAIICVAVGVVFYLAMMMVIGCNRHDFQRIQPWATYFSPLLVGALLSAAYTFAKLKWRGIPAASIWFLQVLFLAAFLVVLLWAVIVLLSCSKQSKTQTTKNSDGSSTTVVTTTTLTGDEDPAETDARSRLGWAILAIVVISVPNFIEIARISIEIFVPFSSPTTSYYEWQANVLLYFDCVRIFGSLIMLIAMFLSKNVRDALLSYITKKNSNSNKIFVQSQKTPLLQEHDEKTKTTTTKTTTKTAKTSPEKTTTPTTTTHTTTTTEKTPVTTTEKKPITTVATISSTPVVSHPTHQTTTVHKTTTTVQQHPAHQDTQVVHVAAPPPQYHSPQYIQSAPVHQQMMQPIHQPMMQPIHQQHQPIVVPAHPSQMYPGSMIPLPPNQPTRFNIQPGYTTMLYAPPNQPNVYIEEI